jgi:hypothetical protein
MPGKGENMKRMIFSGCIILVLASVAFVTYAEMQKISISKDNLAELKGKWHGTRSPNPGSNFNSDLEFFNDSLPVHVKFTFYNVRKRGKADTTEIHEFKRGKINDKGNLLFERGALKVELSLYKDGDQMKLEGEYFASERHGTISFKKK